MPNPTTKQELLAAMADGYVQLNEQKGYYKVTYTTSMAAYFLSVTPYGQAVKKVLVLAGKSAPKIIQDDNLIQYL